MTSRFAVFFVVLLYALCVCPADTDICSRKICLRKCCDFDHARNITAGVCEESELTHPFMNLTNIHVIPNQTCRANEYTIYASVAETQYMGNGFITVEKYGTLGTMLPVDQYCFDNMNGEPGVFVCISMDDVSEEPREHVNTGMIISMPFLFITFLVYLILPDKNVHQNALMLYVLTLLLAYILLVTINLSENLSPFFCKSTAYGTLFLFMVSFFWMNVICFDIWFTFSGGRGYIGSTRTSEKKRFLMYTAYAIGLPIMHVAIVYLLDEFMDPNSIHKPNIGVKKCFLDDGWPSLWYMYGEAAILVLMNVVFFTLTALKIRQVKKETSMLKQGESKRHAYEKDKRRFNLFLKLFLAMGVNWTMEVISWLVNWQTSDKYIYIWYITDFINAIYGGVIFFIFVFKKKIWKMLQKRYYNFIGQPHLARAVTSTTETRSSHYSSSADTHLTERTNISERRHNGATAEELALRGA